MPRGVPLALPVLVWAPEKGTGRASGTRAEKQIRRFHKGTKMKIVWTGVAGAVISLAAAAGLCCYAPAAIETVSEVLTFRPLHGGRPNCDYPYQLRTEAVLALALAAGFVAAVTALGRAQPVPRRVGLRPALLLAGVAGAIAAAAALLLVVIHWQHFLWPLFTGKAALTQQMVAQEVADTVGPLRLGFLLLLAMPMALGAASLVGMGGPRPAAARGWLTAGGAGFAAVVGLGFAAAFWLSWEFACKAYGIIGASGVQLQVKPLVGRLNDLLRRSSWPASACCSWA